MTGDLTSPKTHRAWLILTVTGTFYFLEPYLEELIWGLRNSRGGLLPKAGSLGHFIPLSNRLGNLKVTGPASTWEQLLWTCGGLACRC